MKSLIVTLFFIAFLYASGNSTIYEDDNNEIKRHHLQQKCADFSTTIATSKCIGCSTAKRGQYPWQVELSHIDARLIKKSIFKKAVKM